MATWILGSVATLLTCAVLFKTLTRKHVPPAPTPQPLLIKEAKEVATKDDLEAMAHALEARWEKRFAEQTKTTNDELHRLASAMQNLVTTGHDERESIHLRMNPLVEVTAHMRGQIEILVSHLQQRSHA